jgi:molybdenum cofactor biosynthesis enzyme MoaA
MIKEDTAMAGGHYEKSVYDELMKVMVSLDSMKKETNQKISGLNNEISDLKKKQKAAKRK